jgi:hypothetical protein
MDTLEKVKTKNFKNEDDVSHKETQKGRKAMLATKRHKKTRRRC